MRGGGGGGGGKHKLFGTRFERPTEHMGRGLATRTIAREHGKVCLPRDLCQTNLGKQLLVIRTPSAHLLNTFKCRTPGCRI